MPGILDEPMSSFYYMVNFWRNGMSDEELAQIARKITGKTDPNTYTKADWVQIAQYLARQIPLQPNFKP